jgi:hypothetical protein
MDLKMIEPGALSDSAWGWPMEKKPERHQAGQEERMNLTLTVLSGRYAVCRLGGAAAVPDWAPVSTGSADGGFLSITRTRDELSIVAPEPSVPAAVLCDRGWRCLMVAGPLDLSLTGVLAALASPLAEARVSVFAVSTFDTDYLLVKDERLAVAVETLRRAGHRVAPG